MFLKPQQLRAVKNFCFNSDCKLKTISTHLKELKTSPEKFKTATGVDVVQFSFKPDLTLFEKKLNRPLNLGKMQDAQQKTDSILNSISLNKTLDCIHDDIAIMGESALKRPGVKEYVASIDNALFNEIPKTTKDVILYRGESFPPHSARLQEILMLRPGKELTSNRYTYLTENVEYAQNFQKNNHVKVFYKVLVPQNSNIALTTLEKGCAIAPRNSTHKIVDIEQGVGKVTITSILDTGSKAV